MRLGILTFLCLCRVWRCETNEMPTTSSSSSSSRSTRREKLDYGASSARYKESLQPPPLVAPYGGNLKLLMGIAVPISITGGRILGFGSNFQFQYPLPQNATFFTNYYDDEGRDGATGRGSTSTLRRRRRDRDFDVKSDDARSMFYRSLEMAYERWGGNGKSCLLRSICEAAETPLKDEGLVGELLHVMLTPNYGTVTDLDTSNDDDDEDDDDDVDDYLRAARAGERGESCSLIYRGCPEGAGLLDRISMLDYV